MIINYVIHENLYTYTLTRKLKNVFNLFTPIHKQLEPQLLFTLHEKNMKIQKKRLRDSAKEAPKCLN